MRRVELEHVIRAAADAAEDEEIMVVGSQAILGAGRERDWEFAVEAIRHDLVDPEELGRRIDEMPLSAARLDRLRRTVAGAIARAGAGES